MKAPFDRGGVAIGALFLGVALALGWGADAGLGFGPDQSGYNLWAEELLAAWDEGRSPEDASGSLYRKSFVVLLAAGRRLLGTLEAGYRLILFASALAYLSAMYLLLARVLDHRGVAALTSVLSIVQRYTLGTSFWGMGEFQSILPRIVVLAVFPLAWLLFERHLRSRRVLEAFAVVALGLALHLSAAYFYCILLLTYGLFVAWRRVRRRAMTLAVAAALFGFALAAVPNPRWSGVMEEAGAAAALVTLAGFVLVGSYARSTGRRSGGVALIYLGACCGLLAAPAALTWGGSGPGADVPGSLEAMNAAIYARFGWALFPISGATVAFVLFNGGLVAAVGGYELVRRLRRGATEREHLAALYLVSVVTISLGLTAALQLTSRLAGRPDAVFELFRASRFAFLPLYIYLGLFLERLWRQRRGAGGRLLFGMLVLALLLPPRQMLAAMPDGLKLRVRQAVESSGALHRGDPSQRQYLETLLATAAERRSARTRHRDFLDLCAWVQRSTPGDAVFMTTDYNFIHRARREIQISYAQGARGSARSRARAGDYQAWYQAFVTISEAFASRSAERILAAAERYEVDYVVTAADQRLPPASRVYANGSYRLYRVTR